MVSAWQCALSRAYQETRGRVEAGGVGRQVLHRLGVRLGTAHLLLGLLRHGVPELSTITVDMSRAEIRRQMTEFLSGRVPPMNPARADELITVPRARLPDDLREVVAWIRGLRWEKELAESRPGTTHGRDAWRTN